MSEPTPRPWELGQNQHPMSENFLRPAIGAEGREEAIAIVPSDGDEDAANAKHIVRCVNAFDDLLTACQRMLQAFDPTYPGACHQECFDTSDGHGYELRETAIEATKAAIAKAEA